MLAGRTKRVAAPLCDRKHRLWGMCTTKASDNMLLKETPEQLPVLCFYLLVDSEAAAVCWVTFTVRCCLSAETTFCRAGLMFLLRLWCSPGFFHFLMRVSVQRRIWRVATPTQGRKTESWQLQVLIQMINVTKEITRHRLKWFVSCGCVTTVWCVGSDFAEDLMTDRWSFLFWLVMLMISTSVVTLARFCYISLNLSSLFRPQRQNMCLSSGLHISFSLQTQRTRLTSEQIWAQTKLQSHISSYCKRHALVSFPMSLSLLWIWRKSEQRKKRSKTTAQGVCRLLDDLRSCYEAVCSFSLGARPWSSPPLVVVKRRSQSSRLFVRACRCRRAQSWEELSITGVSDSMPDTRVSNRWEMWSFKRSLKKNGTFVWEGCFLEWEGPEWRLFPRLSIQTACFSLLAVPN